MATDPYWPVTSMVLPASNDCKPSVACATSHRCPDRRVTPGHPCRRGASPGRARGPFTAYSRLVSDQTQTPGSSAAVQRARADLTAGREWKARDRLVGHLAGDYDAEALELLGEIYFTMRDLPSAGAVWFGTALRGERVDAAIDAWRERHHDHFPQMWRSLPRSVREHEGNKRVDALRRRAEQAQDAELAAASPAAVEAPSSGVDAAMVIAIALAVLFVVCAVIGFITLVTWIVSG